MLVIYELLLSICEYMYLFIYYLYSLFIYLLIHSFIYLIIYIFDHLYIYLNIIYMFTFQL